jgi:hypothetical protein
MNFNWEYRLSKEKISIQEALDNWEKIIEEIDKIRGRENYQNWNRTKTGWKNSFLEERNRHNYVFEDFVNLELNPWASFENMPAPMKLLISLNNQDYIFKDVSYIIGD